MHVPIIPARRATLATCQDHRGPCHVSHARPSPRVRIVASHRLTPRPRYTAGHTQQPQPGRLATWLQARLPSVVVASRHVDSGSSRAQQQYDTVKHRPSDHWHNNSSVPRINYNNRSSPPLRSFFDVLATNNDRRGREFISAVEAREGLPIWATQCALATFTWIQSARSHLRFDPAAQIPSREEHFRVG